MSRKSCGQVIEDREYKNSDYERNLVLGKRTQFVAAKSHGVSSRHGSMIVS